MPLHHTNFFSQSLGICVSIDAIVPLKNWTKGAAPTRAKHPTLYLLHGHSDDHTIWQRRTSIERYVEDYDLAVIMPAVNRSFYTDEKIGYDYWTFVSEELPYVARSLFPLSDRREDNFVAGLSMGGYGAFKMALAHPERFSFAASLSGAVDIGWMYEGRDKAHQKFLRSIFGTRKEAVGSENDLHFLAQRAAAGKTPKPKLYQYCGTEDFLIESNRQFAPFLEELGFDLTYEEGPGDHRWQYWDEKIQTFLNMLPLKPINPAPKEP
jgi:putative tributyrin esterase